MLTSDLIESSFKKINSAEMKSLGFMDLLELHRYFQNTRLQTARGLLLFLFLCILVSNIFFLVK